MNPETAGVSHLRKQSFHEDEYRAFRIALDVKETEIAEFWKNIDKLKSKKEFAQIHEKFTNNIIKKKNILKEKNKICDEKVRQSDKMKDKTYIPLKVERDGENLQNLVDSKENVPLSAEKESVSMKKKSKGARKKESIQKKKTDYRHTSVTDATNTSNANEIIKKVKISKDTRALREKKNFIVREQIEKGKKAEVSKSNEVRKNTKKEEKILHSNAENSGKEFQDDVAENQKSKSNCQLEFKEEKDLVKHKKTLIKRNQGASRFSRIKDKNSTNKKTNDEENKEDEIVKKQNQETRTNPRKKMNEKTKNFSETEEKEKVVESTKNKRIEAKMKKSRIDKTKVVKEVEVETNFTEIKRTESGNDENEIKKSKVTDKSDAKRRRSKTNKNNIQKQNADHLDERNQQGSAPKISRSRETDKSIESKRKKKIAREKKDTNLLQKGEEKYVNKKNESVTENVNPTPTEETNKVDTGSIKSVTYSDMTKEQNNKHLDEDLKSKPEEMKTSSINLTDTQDKISPKKQAESLKLVERRVTFKSIDETNFKKCNSVYNDINNLQEKNNLTEKSIEKLSLAQASQNPYLLENKIDNSENFEPSSENLKMLFIPTQCGTFYIFIY